MHYVFYKSNEMTVPLAVLVVQDVDQLPNRLSFKSSLRPDVQDIN